MLIKSYEISKKDLNFSSFFLIYGENIGLKQDIIKSVLELKEKRNGKYKLFKFEEEEIIKNKNGHTRISSKKKFFQTLELLYQGEV